MEGRASKCVTLFYAPRVQEANMMRVGASSDAMQFYVACFAENALRRKVEM